MVAKPDWVDKWEWRRREAGGVMRPGPTKRDKKIRVGREGRGRGGHWRCSGGVRVGVILKVPPASLPGSTNTTTTTKYCVDTDPPQGMLILPLIIHGDIV